MARLLILDSVSWLILLCIWFSFGLPATPIEQGGKVEETENVYDQIRKVNKDWQSKLFEGDIVYDRTVDEVTEVDERTADEPYGDYASDAVRNRSYLWTSRIVPFEFTAGYTKQEQEIVYSAMRTIENASCIVFKNHTNEDNWVKFTKQGGCFSQVGRMYRRRGAQALSLADGCYERMIVVHELLHSLGFWHEQSRPDRDRYIEIFWENINDKVLSNFDKYSHQEADTLNLPYDYKTIMHYGKYTGSLYPGKPTMLAIGNKDLKLGGSKELTPTDIIQLNRLYNCKSASNKQVMSDWTDFGPCDGFCYKKRQKFCTLVDNSKCPNVDQNGIAEEKLKCSNAECYAPVDGHWGRWGSWGPCLPECGQRKQVRKRYCNNPVPKNGGKPCDAGISEESSPCSPKSCSLTCDFDAEEWCGWRNSYSNKYRFHWKRQNYRTPSKNTGPEVDHTTGKAGKGYFVFTEASHPAEKGDRARLFSKMVNGNGINCIYFWYHMHGPKMGTLRVYELTEDGYKTLIWRKTGDQGNKWILAEVEVYNRVLYQVIFDAERGEDFGSDIGLDDITVEEEFCKGSLELLCGFPMRKMGCYKDESPNRALPDLLASNRHLISWKKYHESLAIAVCDCAKRTRNKGNNVFGIQYYSECWTGPGNVTYMTYGKSNKCIDGKFEACSNRLSDGKLCAGRGYVNYVYELL